MQLSIQQKKCIQQKKWLKSVFVASALLASGMSISAASAAVITSIRPLGFIASAIADGVTPTEVLLPDGASPHDYALRPSDVQRLQSADLVIWVGPEMEAFLGKPLAKISPAKQIALSALPAIKSELEKDAGHDHESEHEPAHDDHEKGHDHSHATHDDGDDGHHHGEYNMHIWLSPEMTKQAAIAIHAKLLELMPQNKDKLDANLLYFTDKIAQADEKIVKMLAPVQGKGYFVFHDAYGYFEKHYGLSPLGYFTVNPEIQPVHSVYIKYEHSWLSIKPYAFLLNHNSGQPLLMLLPREPTCARVCSIHWEALLHWVEIAMPISCCSYRTSM